MKKKCSVLISACLVIAFLFGQSGLIGARAATPSSKGKLAIDEMKRMANFTWTSNTYPSVKIYSRTYQCGYIFKGLPYTWSADNNLTEFLACPSLVYAAPVYRYYLSQPKSDYGNDCSTAVAWAWKAAGSGVDPDSIYTGTMFNAARSSQSCMKKRGSFSTPEYFDNVLKLKGTKYWITASNQNAVYDTLKPGDVCFYHYEYINDYGVKKYKGHAILITDIDTVNNKVWYLDQNGGQDFINQGSSWTTGSMTYDQLRGKFYVPLTASDISI